MQLRFVLVLLVWFLIGANSKVIEIIVKDLTQDKAEKPKVVKSAPSTTYEYLVNDLVLEFRRQLKDKIAQLITNFSWQKSSDGKSIEFLANTRTACNESSVLSTELRAISRINLTSNVATSEQDKRQKTITTTAEFYACNINAIRFKEIFVVTGKDIEAPTLDQFLQSDIKVTLQPDETYRYYAVELRGQIISAITTTRRDDRTTISFDATGSKMYDITIYDKKNESKIDFEAYPFTFSFESSFYTRTIAPEDITRLTVLYPKNSNFVHYFQNQDTSISKTAFNIPYQKLFVEPITLLHAQLYTNLVASFPITTVDSGVSKDSEFFNELVRVLTVRLTKPNPTETDIRDVRRFMEQTRDRISTGKLIVTEQK